MPGPIYLLEGQLKVIACHHAGIRAIAAGGTAFTDQQAALLARLDTPVHLAYDNDDAGRQATLRTAQLLRRLRIPIRIATLQIPPGIDHTGKIDPDDLLEVLDASGDGGACHHYLISGFDSETNPSAELTLGTQDSTAVSILFQNGPIPDAGVNGVTQEALIAICIDRLQGFQSGPYACRENDIALAKLQEAQMWLLKRTRDRMARNVEGTHNL
jgi:hypothetical protein